MMVDVSKFTRNNVVDACAVWNIVSSRLLFSTAQAAGCIFCCTGFVLYECLLKPRTAVSQEDLELQERLRDVRGKGAFKDYNLTVADLQEVEVLENRQRLGKGELSAIVFARKIGQAVLTDDQQARKLAQAVLEPPRVQTTPHLFGWLFYGRFLTDGDKDPIIAEHASLRRPLRPHLERAYSLAMERRLMKPPEDTD